MDFNEQAQSPSIIFTFSISSLDFLQEENNKREKVEERRQRF
jgi:hypothetical protein